MCGLILLGNASTGRVSFVLQRSAIFDEGTEQPPIILDVGIHGAGDAIRVEMIRLRFIKLLVPWVVYKKGVGCGGTSNRDAVHGICLVFEAFGVSILGGVKVVNREQ